MKKEKSIETRALKIKGNIMCWDDTMIQLSNVSCISTSLLEQEEFPKSAILVIVFGILLFRFNKLFSIILLFGGVAWISIWYNNNEKRKTETVLSICLNSGNNFRFLFREESFLYDVLYVLEQIIIDGGVGDQNVEINVQNCEFSGNSKVLDNLKILNGGFKWE